MRYDNDNIFAKILRGEIPCDKLYEDEAVLAFNDIAPIAPAHVLVIPKNAYVSFDDFVANADGKEVAAFWSSVAIVAKQLGLDEQGYRLISNHKSYAGQTVFHFHVHIIGGTQLGDLLPQ